MRHTIGGILLLLLLLCLGAPAAGQTPAGGPCNPYEDACAAWLVHHLDAAGRIVALPSEAAMPAQSCRLDATTDAVTCSNTTPNAAPVAVAPTIFRFTEGVVQAPGSELAFVILANFDTAAKGVEVEYLLQGQPRPVWRSYVVQPHERRAIAVHEDPAFPALSAFSVRVFWPGDGDAQLVMRPAVDAFSRATIPAPAVTSGRFYTPPEN